MNRFFLRKLTTQPPKVNVVKQEYTFEIWLNTIYVVAVGGLMYQNYKLKKEQSNLLLERDNLFQERDTLLNEQNKLRKQLNTSALESELYKNGFKGY